MIVSRGAFRVGELAGVEDNIWEAVKKLDLPLKDGDIINFTVINTRLIILVNGQSIEVK